MEVNEHGFLEELLAFRRDGGMNHQFMTNGWSFDSLEENPEFIFPGNTTSFEGFSTASNEVPCFEFSGINKMYCSFGDGLLEEPMQEIEHNGVTMPPFLAQECNQFRLGDAEVTGLNIDQDLCRRLEETTCKIEHVQGSEIICLESKDGVKKVNGQPSKNLMAERRRRKRLNDRLSMLRSVVPKISKMDRTSIVGDTVDYVKELLQKIKDLQGVIEVDSNQLSLFKDQNPNEFIMRNTPKFDVERRNADTRIDICCSGKPGLLLSTVNALETLGLDIQQCVISCFNDFSMQAFCSEKLQQRDGMSPDDIKQALFRNAGYGGKCL